MGAWSCSESVGEWPTEEAHVEVQIFLERLFACFETGLDADESRAVIYVIAQDLLFDSQTDNPPFSFSFHPFKDPNFI